MPAAQSDFVYLELTAAQSDFVYINYFVCSSTLPTLTTYELREPIAFGAFSTP
jgi:hypothetical protein